jgi:hypothetical protein
MSVYTIDTRPQGVALKAYAGDTLVFNVITDVDYSSHVWTGEIRSEHYDATPDATFTFGDSILVPAEGAVPDKWHTAVTLAATATRALAELSPDDDLQPQYIKIGTALADAVSLQQYSGIWDIQVESGGVVTTLVQGTITVDADVTRAV